MMQSLDPKSSSFDQGNKILQALRTIKDHEDRRASSRPSSKASNQEDQDSSSSSSALSFTNANKIREMTYEEFRNDPFGKARQQLRDSRKKQKEHTPYEEIESDGNKGQARPVNLAESPQ